MKALVLFSGGVDSTTCLAECIKHYGIDNVHTLSMFYGQKHDKELDAVGNIIDYYGIKHCSELDLSSIFKDSKCSLLQGSSVNIPIGDYSTQIDNTGIISTYVPFRNGLFLSVAASIAISKDCDYVYYAAHVDDSRVAYPDCSDVFNQYMRDAIYYGTGEKIKIVAPYIHLRKSDIVRIGLGLNVPYHLTWSCYAGKEKPCGECATCIDRKKAFELNGIQEEY